MKVLLTTPTYPPFNSGLGNVVAAQARQLTGRGVEVVVATGGSNRSSTEMGSVRIEKFPISGSGFAADPIRGDVAAYHDFAARERSDVIIMHAWQTWSTDVLLSRLDTLPGRKVVWSHCISTNTRVTYSPLKSSLRRLLWRPYWWSLPGKMRKLDALVFLASDGDDDRFDDVRLARKLGLPYHVIPNSAWPTEATTSVSGRRTIIAVGSYVPAKGFDFVLDAYARSSAKNKIPLLLHGQTRTPYFEQLAGRAEGLGIQTGYLEMRVGISGEALAQAYRTARLILSGSQTECQPLVLLDAMAAGVPFVARRTGCVSGMPGGIAVVSPAEAAASIDRLVLNEAEWEELSLKGRLAARTTHDPLSTGERLMALLAELAG